MADQNRHQVHCSISNCHYWEQGNVCRADRILVTSHDMAKNLADKVDAPLAAGVTATPVSKCYDSCCKTFVLKTDNSQNTDGVLKLE